MELNIEKSWRKCLKVEFEQEYFKELTRFVKNEYKNGVVYPASENIFRALRMCPFDKVKVVILGQDPYHGAGQANGLAFAVNQNVTIPLSLKNIFKEIQNDIVEIKPEGRTLNMVDADLSRWTEQGVLLLNATLTVRAGAAGSHQKKGWEEFTDAVIGALSDEREGIVFMLWGNYAKAKGARVNRSKHLVLEAAHPSPLSAYKGFFGCKHFSEANDYLLDHAEASIDWHII